VRLELSQVAPERPVDTVFWGGGTPGLLAARDLRELGRIVREACVGDPAEWTIELAPGSVTDERLEALREVGVTRVSLGVQSFQPALLEALGRRHSREQVLRAHQRVRAAGFASVNLDLMFALPGQADESWEADLGEALALGPDHLSTYCLTFEEDTRLWVKLSRGQVRRDAEAEARLYEATWRRLEAAGYPQYEVSNFARPGHACRHNVNTWRMGEWIGVGPSAASQHRGWRGANVADLSRWLEGLDRGERMTEDRRAVTPALLAEDALVFGLRMNEGVDLGYWRERAPGLPWSSVLETLTALEEAGRLESRGNLFRLTPTGRLVADAIGAEIISAFSPEAVEA
jgi:oxygen-independent coproporphyrinogen-3 oxidase